MQSGVLVAFVMLGVQTYLLQAGSLNVVEITNRLAQNESLKRNTIQEFAATRRYILRNSHWHHDAVMVVRVSFKRGEGKTFQVLDVQGAEGLSRRVLERVMQGEEQDSRSARPDESSVTPAHYDFRMLGMETIAGRNCYVLETKPKMKSRYLLQGKAWVDAQDFALIRIEGRPSASLGFWAGKPYIVQQFEKQGDFWMASHNRSQSESHLLGKSELNIEYTAYDLNCSGSKRLAARRSAAASLE